MSEAPHPNLSISIFVDGRLACECTKADMPLFIEAYKALNPTAIIETFSVLQMAKRKKAKREAQEAQQEGLDVD